MLPLSAGTKELSIRLFILRLLRQRHRRELSILRLEAVDKSVYDGPSTIGARCSSNGTRV